ncbi:MAG: RNA methyltransferase [Anaerolineae bacterium]|nr:MAG: RNA methyltransferase [Anaerolineae bacterium]
MRPLIGTELKRFLRNFKRENRTKRSLILILQSVEYPYNVGAIFRMADGAGVGELILTGITPLPPNPTIDKVARSKTRSVKWRYSKEIAGDINDLRNRGYAIIGLEITDDAVPFYSYDFPERTCLVVGNEDHGLTKKTLSACDASIFIPMYGKGRSHNVGTATAIATYHILHSAPSSSSVKPDTQI